jgi:hypothetical protein
VYGYQWESSTDQISWSQIIGQTQQGIQPGNTAVTVYYRRIVNALPCDPNTSNAIEILVLPVIGNNSIQSDQTICQGNVPNAFSGSLPSGGNGGYAYQWLSSVQPVGPWSQIPGEVNPNYTSGAISQNTYYRRVVVSGPCADTSAVISIITTPGIGNNLIGSAQIICAGNTPNALTGTLPTGGNGVYLYQWESSSNLSVWAPVVNATVQNFSPGALTQTVYFRRTVTAGPCPVSTSATIQITVNPSIGNNTIVSNQTICTGQTPAQ